MTSFIYKIVNIMNMKCHHMSSQIKLKEIPLLFDVSNRTNLDKHTNKQTNFLAQLCVEIQATLASGKNLKFHQMSSQIKLKEIPLLFDVSNRTSTQTHKQTNTQTHKHTNKQTHKQTNYQGQLCVEIQATLRVAMIFRRKFPTSYNKEPGGSLVDIYQGFAGPQRRAGGMGSTEFKVGQKKNSLKLAF